MGIKIKGEKDKENRFQVYTLKKRDTTIDWDIFEEHIGVVDHVNKQKEVIHFIVRPNIDGVIRFSELEESFLEGDAIAVNMAPNENMFDWLRDERQDNPKQSLSRVLGKKIPARLCEKLFPAKDLLSNIADFSNDRLDEIATIISKWSVLPQGTEGYRTAEVTKGGINTDELSSKTMESKKVPGLYFIGEAVDVTGWLGGYNFQWAWSSGWAAGQAVCQK